MRMDLCGIIIEIFNRNLPLIHYAIRQKNN